MLDKEIRNALDVLRAGGVILYPTDTVWGLGCDALNDDAIERIKKIKNRPDDKSFIILVDSAAKIDSYAEDVPDVAYDLIEFAENPLTVIYERAKNLPVSLQGENGSIGIRVVKHDFCTPLIQRLRSPLVSTSANPSGLATPRDFSEVADEIKNAVDYVVDFEQNLSVPRKPSTIMRINAGGQFDFIRR